MAKRIVMFGVVSYADKDGAELHARQGEVIDFTSKEEKRLDDLGALVPTDDEAAKMTALSARAQLLTRDNAFKGVEEQEAARIAMQADLDLGRTQEQFDAQVDLAKANEKRANEEADAQRAAAKAEVERALAAAKAASDAAKAPAGRSARGAAKAQADAEKAAAAAEEARQQAAIAETERLTVQADEDAARVQAERAAEARGTGTRR